LVTLPKDKKTIRCNGCTKSNTMQMDLWARYKARLVTKGYAQTYGTYYEETYSLIAKWQL
jgi:hypothetical protein